MTEEGHRTQRARPTDFRSFGRRHGRKLSPRQQALLDVALPRVRLDLASPAPADLTGTLFGEPIVDLWLEVGFGGAEHLVWQAERHPEVGLIGCEPFDEGVVKALGAIEARALGNIRIHADDARDVLHWLPPASIGRAFVLFPDPWPKARHAKRRFVHPAMLPLVARVLRPGAEWRIASDDPTYQDWVEASFADQPFFALRDRAIGERPEGWFPTRYEAKAIREGRVPHYWTFVRSDAPWS